jgi:hypothetical protein
MPVPPLILGDQNETIDAPYIILSAAQLAMQRNAKMQALENQLQGLSQKYEMGELKREQDFKIAEMRHESDIRRAQDAEERNVDLDRHYRVSEDIATKSADIREKTATLNEEKIRAQLLDAAQKLDLQRKSQFLREVGMHGFRDSQAFDNPDIVKEPSEMGWHADKSKPGYRFYGAYDDSTKKYYYPSIDRQTGQLLKAPPITMKDEDFADFLDRYKEHESNPITSLVPGTLTPAPAPQQTVMPAPADPSARQAGTPYVTPKGVLIWTGTGWKSQ